MVKNTETAGFKIAFKAIATLLIIFGLVITLIIQYLDFRPIRKANIDWKISNSSEVLRNLLAFARAVIFTLGKIELFPLLLSLFLELKIMKDKRKNHGNFLFSRGSVINQIPFFFVFGMHIITIFFEITKN